MMYSEKNKIWNDSFLHTYGDALVSVCHTHNTLIYTHTICMIKGGEDIHEKINPFSRDGGIWVIFVFSSFCFYL